jgi:glycosyltransferase involved in cell wall biosynthesis
MNSSDRGTDKLRIAFVSDAVYPYNKGGKEKRLYEISKRLAQRGHDVHIYTMKWWAGSGKMDQEGVHFHAICGLMPLYDGKRRSISEAVFFGLATFKLFFEQFDVIDVDQMPFFPLWSGWVVARVKRKKMQTTWLEVWDYNYWQEYAKGFVGLIGALIERISIALPDTIISISKHTTEQLRVAGAKAQIVTVPLGVDLASISAVKPSTVSSDIIFVGRLLSHKNADLLVKAVLIVKETMPQVSCKIVGGGPEKKELENLITRLKLEDNVQILDNIEHCCDLYALMKSSKMLVLPSTREGFGIVVIEANAAGLPVITTNHRNNAARDLIVEGINGFFADPDPKSIAEAIANMLKNRATMRPKRDIYGYSWEVVVEKLEQFLMSNQKLSQPAG